MPSTYAHYRMGQEVREALHGREREIVEDWPELYLIGLHGPDILFYYRALFPNRVNAVGFGLHEKPGRTFFESARRAVLEREDREPALAYAYGVLNHFALDVSCHAYVDEKIAASGITHTEIEVEFDRSLMLEDGLNPVTQVLTDHIRPTGENAAVIAPFYPGVTAAEVRKSLRSMIFYNRLLLARTRGKRELVYGVLKLTGNFKEMHGLIVNPGGNPVCEDSNARLRELYGLARERAVEFIDCFDAWLEKGQPLPAIFDYTFGGKLPESGKEV